MRRSGQDVDLEAEGEGRKRRLALAIHGANLELLEAESATSPAILAYDEPDTHLDYASQRELFGILERQARLDHVQVVVATHSLNFIDRVPLDAIVHLQLDGNLRTQVEFLEANRYREQIRFLESVGRGLGLRNSVLLDERCFLIVEGETEEAAIPDLFRLVTAESLIGAGIVLINTRGFAPIRQVMAFLHKEWGRELVVLADNDKRSEILAWAERAGLEEGRHVFFIGTKEFEDAFGDDTWLSVLSRHFPPRDGGNGWTIGEERCRRRGARRRAWARSWRPWFLGGAGGPWESQSWATPSRKPSQMQTRFQSLSKSASKPPRPPQRKADDAGQGRRIVWWHDGPAGIERAVGSPGSGQYRRRCPS